MKTKKILLFLLIIAVGQIIFMFWNVENAVIKGELAAANMAATKLALRFLVITFAVKLAGDFLGRFIFKFPGYDWMYIRAYLSEEFFATLGIYFAFSLVWLAFSFLVFYIKEVEAFRSLFLGGFLPASYYMFISNFRFDKKESSEKRLSRKI
jgi:hypothetical protein